MQIELNDSEIKCALKEYVGKQGISIINKKIDINIVAGRGANGFKASVDIQEDLEKMSYQTNTTVKGSDILADPVLLDTSKPEAVVQPVQGSLFNKSAPSAEEDAVA